MPISYAVIARGDAVLTHYTSTSGNFITVTSFLLQKISLNDSQVSYSYDGHMFHIIVERGTTFLCLTEESFDRRTAFAFFDTKSRFFSRYSDEVITQAAAFSLNDDFSRILANQMDYYSHNPAADKINQVKLQLENTKEQMNNNIEKLLSRMERVDLLVGNADTMNQQATKFQSQSKEVQWKIYKKNLKYMFFIVIIVVIILWLCASLFCGLSLRQC